MRSLASRMVVTSTAGISVFLVASSFVTDRVVRAEWVAELDRGLEVQVDTVLAAAQRTWFRSQEPGPPRGGPSFARLADVPELRSIAFVCFGPAGEVLGNSEGLEPTLPLDLRQFEAGRCRWVEQPGMGTSRAREGWLATEERPRPPPPEGARRPPPPRSPELRCVVVRSATEFLAALTSLRRTLVVACASALLGCGLISLLVIVRGLRPLDRLGTQIRALDVADLDRRIDLADAPAELVPVIDQLHSLLDRLRAALQREQSFTADVAHELRTPLAGLRSTLELAISRPRSNEELRVSVDRSLRIALEMQRLVESLLTLARVGAGCVDIEPVTLGLSEWVECVRTDFASRMRSRALDWEVQVRSEGSGDIAIRADRALLRHVVHNLFDNACEYADEGSVLRSNIFERDGCGVWTLANACATATDELAHTAFEVFSRGDRARSSTGRHAGLGLPLCRKIVETLGGTITARATVGSFEVEVALPRADLDPPQAS